MLEVARSKHVLRPDFRFLGAIAEVKRTLRGTNRGRLQASFRSHRWRLNLDGEDVGILSDISSFDEALDLLRVWARRWLDGGITGPTPGSADAADRRADAENPYSLGTVGGLEVLDRDWHRGIRNPEALDLAGRRLLTLCIQSLDRVGIADALYAKTLALLAIREAAQGRRIPEDEAILAGLMEYQWDAETLSEPLSANSSARMWVRGIQPDFRREAEKKGADRRLRYLFLLRFAPETHLSEWARWVEEYCPELTRGVPLARAGLELTDFGPEVWIAQDLLNDVLRELTGESLAAAPRGETRLFRQPLPGIWAPRDALARFENALVHKTEGRGALFDGDTQRAYFRSLFYSALYTIGVFELDRRSSTPEALEFARLLESGPKGPAADFARWYGDLARVQNDARAVPSLLSDLDTLESLGQPALERIADEARRRIAFNDPQRAVFNERVERRLDARRASRLTFGSNCVVTRLALPCNERFYLSAVRMYGRKWYETFPGSLRRIEGPDALHRMVGDPSVKASARMTALEILVHRKLVGDSEISASAMRIARENPQDGEAVYSAISLLRSQGRLRAAEDLARKRFLALPATENLKKADWASLLARILDDETRSQEAWEVVEPWVETQKSEAMGAASSVLESLGRHDQASNLARVRVERYPDGAEGRAGMAEVLWRQGRAREVPALFQDPAHPPSGFDWSKSIGRSFGRAFRGHSIGEIESAFIPMVEAKINPWYLLEMAKPMAESGRPDAAFAMLAAVTSRQSSGIGALDPRFNAYRYRKAWKGKEEAAEWVRAVVKPPLRLKALETTLDEGLGDLFWSIEDPPAGPATDSAELLRAIAAKLDPSRARRDTQSLLCYFENARHSPQSDYAAFLIGTTPASQFLQLASQSDRRGAVAYYLGIQAIAEGDYETASDWLEICIETGKPSREFDSAGRILRRWIDSDHSLAEMQQEPFLSR